MSEYTAGQIVQRGGKDVLVTRVVNQTAFFEDHVTNECYLLIEFFLEFLDDENQISFLTLSEVRQKIAKPEGLTFRGPDTLEWRKISG